jgi:hypothetical protein
MIVVRFAQADRHLKVILWQSIWWRKGSLAALGITEKSLLFRNQLQLVGRENFSDLVAGVD